MAQKASRILMPVSPGAVCITGGYSMRKAISYMTIRNTLENPYARGTSQNEAPTKLRDPHYRAVQ